MREQATDEHFVRICLVRRACHRPFSGCWVRMPTSKHSRTDIMGRAGTSKSVPRVFFVRTFLGRLAPSRQTFCKGVLTPEGCRRPSPKKCGKEQSIELARHSRTSRRCLCKDCWEGQADQASKSCRRRLVGTVHARAEPPDRSSVRPCCTFTCWPWLSGGHASPRVS